MNEVIEATAVQAQSLPLQVTQHDPLAAAPRQLSVVEYAVQSGAPVAEVRALMELQVQADNHKLAMLQAKRVMDREDEVDAAKRAFAADFATFKAKEIVTITKDKHVSFQGQKGITEYDHATIGNVVRTITEAIAKYGFSHSWATRQQGATVYVTCTLRHKLGHFEEVTLSADSDTSGGKNSIQGIGSAITYLQRYTLLAITGCASSDQPDDDGAAAESPEEIAAARLELWTLKANATSDLAALRKVTSDAAAAFSAQRDKAGYATFGAAAQARAAVLKEAAHVA